MSNRFAPENIAPWKIGEEPATDGDYVCDATDGFFICTRPPHIDGQHVAHGEHPEHGIYIVERWNK